MSLAERSGHFDPEVIYNTEYRHPHSVAESTATFMDMYLNRQFWRDMKPAQEFLQETTIPFVDSAREGLTENIHKIRKNPFIINPSLLQTLFGRQATHRKEDVSQMTEDFQYSVVVFAFMPSETKSESFFPDGFPRRGALAPPFTIREFIHRYNEMEYHLTQISNQKEENEQWRDVFDKLHEHGEKINPVTLLSNPSFLRTYAFFKTASTLPLKYKETPREVEQKAKSAFDRLLGDTIIPHDF